MSTGHCYLVNSHVHRTLSRQFRIFMAKGGKESLRTSYRRSKSTLISREKKSPSTVLNGWKLWPEGYGRHGRRWFFFSRNEGQLRAAVTRPCRLPTPLCHTYSEPSGHEDSPGGTQNIPYLFKNLSKSRLSDPFFGFFWWFLRSGARFT